MGNRRPGGRAEFGWDLDSLEEKSACPDLQIVSGAERNSARRAPAGIASRKTSNLMLTWPGRLSAVCDLEPRPDLRSTPAKNELAKEGPANYLNAKGKERRRGSDSADPNPAEVVRSFLSASRLL